MTIMVIIVVMVVVEMMRIMGQPMMTTTKPLISMLCFGEGALSTTRIKYIV